jgi:hypothetical protein
MTPAEINALWGRLTRIYPAWSLPIDMFISPSTWRLLGSNLAPSVVRDGKARRLAAILSSASPEAAEKMTDMARLNVWRTSDIFRLVAVGYVSMPIAIAALLSEAAPDFLRELLAANIGAIVSWVIILTITPIVYFCSMWRAKQIQWAIEYYKAGAIELPAVRAARA